MYFTNGDHRAFESLMQDRPGSDHYDSGVDGPYPECRGCREHQPYRRDRFCRYAEWQKVKQVQHRRKRPQKEKAN